MNRILAERGGRVLAFGAHPDDLEVGAGGLLARLSRAGADVTLAIVSIPNNTETRKAEAQAAADVLDAELFILNEDKPCRVEDIAMHELVRRMDTVIGDVRPDLVDHPLRERPPLGSRPRQSRDRVRAAPHAVRPARLPVEPRDERAVALVRQLLRRHHRASSTRSSPRSRVTRRSSPKLDLESSRDLARAMGRISGYGDAEVLRDPARPRAIGSNATRGGPDRGLPDPGRNARSRGCAGAPRAIIHDP